jgi:hypothetical protein
MAVFMNRGVAIGALVGALIPAIAWVAVHDFGRQLAPAMVVVWPSCLLLFSASGALHSAWGELWALASVVNIVWYALLGVASSYLRLATASLQHNTLHVAGTGERWATRVAAFVIGLFLAIGLFVNLLLHSHARRDWLTASPLQLAFMVLVCALSFAMGTVFITIGVKGGLPEWLARRLD